MGNKYSFGVTLQNTQRCFGYRFGLGTPSFVDENTNTKMFLFNTFKYKSGHATMTIFNLA